MNDHADDPVLAALDELASGVLLRLDVERVIRRGRRRLSLRRSVALTGGVIVVAVSLVGVVRSLPAHGRTSSLDAAASVSAHPAPAAQTPGPVVPLWTEGESVPFTPVVFGTDSGSVDLTVLLDDGAYVQVASWATSAATVSASNPTALRAAQAAFDPATGDAHAVADPYTRLLTGIVPASASQVTVSGMLGHVVVPTYPIPGYAIRVFVVPAAGVSAGRWTSDYFTSTDVDGSHLLSIGQRSG